jgi:S-adenosylmethionine hydrolase
MNSSEASKNRIITLITDFGYRDPFVGQMKGVILKINPYVKIIDITHDITSHDIEEASFILWESFKYFPEETIHLIVVDPQVGSKRKALIVKSQNHYFVAPDNGVLSHVIKEQSFTAFSIEEKKYILKKHSPTFQGRDIFAPVSAWLSKGIPIEKFGKPFYEPFMIDIPLPEKTKNKIVGKIIYIDKFGNAITNIKASKKQIKHIKIAGLKLPIVNYYAESPQNPAALINSNGFVEIFIYKGNAAGFLNLKKGMNVEAIIYG